MAHIPDGILSLPVIAGGTLLAAGGVALGLRALDEDAIAETALLAAAFFVVSLLAVPLGPSSVHLLLGGLSGILIGWRAFPAVLVGLALQAVLFGFGGLTTLGVDTLDMALPGIAAAALARPWLDPAAPRRAMLAAGAVGALAVLGTGGGVVLALALSSPDYRPSLPVVAATYLPLAAVEAAVTASAIGFLARVRPEALARGRMGKPAGGAA